MERGLRTRFFLLGLLPPFVLGTTLRLLGVRSQLLTDDELHTVGAVLAMPVGEIVRNITYEGADYCVPLTALFRMLMDAGVVFSELDFRIPSLLAGLLALWLVPTLLAPRIGRQAAVLCAWLLAISPMLVLYSRMVRPYMAATLTSFCAVMAFDTWLRTRSRRAAASYVGLAALSVYLHLGAGPFVLAPFAFLGFELLRRRRPEQLLPAVLLFAAVGCAIALPLLPAFDSLVELMQIRRDGLTPPLASWLEVVALQVGTRSAALAAAFAGLGLYGAWCLQRRDASFLGLIASLAAIQVLGLLLLSPDRMQEASVLSRYLLLLLPFGLALVAVALADALERAPSAPLRAALIACVAGLGALLYASGPLASRDYSAGSFTHTPSFLRLTHEADRIPGQYVPAFYHELASQPTGSPIVEHPWMRHAGHSFAAYQNVHHQPVLLSSPVEGYHDPRLDLANIVRPTSEDFLASRARFVVVHLDLRGEAERVETGDPHQRIWLRARAQLWEPLRRSGKNTSARLRREWGRPFYADETIEVWDLDAVRAERIR